MREIKHRLRVDNKIVGYEKWYGGNRNSDGLVVASPLWLYSTDGNYWNPDYIFHTHKDVFTGLLDKNGKQIYEGDLLKGVPIGMEPRSILEVFWDETMASFYVRIKNKLDGTVVWNDMLEGFTKEYTVIGNIYENPELLK